MSVTLIEKDQFSIPTTSKAKRTASDVVIETTSKGQEQKLKAALLELEETKKVYGHIISERNDHETEISQAWKWGQCIPPRLNGEDETVIYSDELRIVWGGLMMEPEGKHRNSIMKQRILAVFGLVEIVLRCTLTMNDFQGLMMQLEGPDETEREARGRRRDGRDVTS
ncbi:hypothetical protein EVAR_77634_1 [Eumeta japonica]|uniref:Uncharacterized protein n=1 Tax=Eumeta variegata TaxID=151549 RepID=A0A4C1T749_EUMVA|nr:hypothetical protein EVAR_77634_1 [Eumeta japonica]